LPGFCPVSMHSLLKSCENTRGALAWKIAPVVPFTISAYNKKMR
jgi:hypothetical protein